MNKESKELVLMLQRRCLQRGIGALKQLSCAFRRLDIDYSKKICFQELQDGMRDFKLDLTHEELTQLFQAMDRDGNGHVDFKEFMDLLTPPMKPLRVAVINEAFDKMDINKDEVLRTDELQVVYASNARKHPKYVSGEWTEEQTLRHFLDSLDTPGSPDGKVTRQEFLNYYAGVSATVDDDCYFDLVMRSVYGLSPASSKRQARDHPQQHRH